MTITPNTLMLQVFTNDARKIYLSGETSTYGLVKKYAFTDNKVSVLFQRTYEENQSTFEKTLIGNVEIYMEKNDTDLENRLVEILKVLHYRSKESYIPIIKKITIST